MLAIETRRRKVVVVRVHLEAVERVEVVLAPLPNVAHCIAERASRCVDRCWRAVAPQANRMIWFGHKVLHKVCPAYAPRYALTHFWFSREKAEMFQRAVAGASG